MIIQHQLIGSLKKNHSRVAVETATKSITYADLFKMSNEITAFLLQKKMAPETMVGICVEDRLDIIASIIGVIQARCVFVLLDNTLPDERLASMVKNTKLDHVILSKGNLVNKEFVVNCQYFLEDIWERSHAESLPPISYPAFEENDSLYVYFTSGSTGRPKGIVGRNCSLLQFALWEIEAFPIDATSRVSQFISPYFDAFLRDIFVPLLSGATICIPPQTDDFFLSDHIIRWIDRSNINLIHCVPSLFRSFNSQSLTDQNFKDLKYVLLSGEKINPGELAGWYERFGDRIQLVNLYGTTETTMIRSFYRIQPEDSKLARIPIGFPISDTQLLVSKKDFKPCSPLAAGDLYIISDYVTKGYLNDPVLTREKFLKFIRPDGSETIAFRTGDNARILPDGKIELIGREDRQVKLRGIRIELDEVESILMQSGKLKNAVVILHTDEGGNEMLAAFIIKKDALDVPDLREDILVYLRGCVPAYMIPSNLMQVEEYPLLSNGKIDYKGLLKFLTVEKEIIAPVNSIEEKLLEIWKDILGDKPISTDDAFHQIGGNSLTIMNLISRISKAYNVRIPLIDLFKNPSIKKQREFIERAKRDFWVFIPEADRRDDYPLSSAQKRLYFLHRFDPTSRAYNIPQIVKLHGKLDRERLATALNGLIERHESLRTCFVLIKDKPVQKIVEHVDFKIEYVKAKSDETGRIVDEFIRPFDLRVAPLLRVGLIETGPEEHLLLTDAHHIVMDEVSQVLLVRDFMKLYNNSPLSALKLQYRDYAVWQQSEEQQNFISDQKSFWINEFSEPAEVLELPIDFARPLVRSHQGASDSFELKAEEIKSLKQIAASADATMFMVVMSLWNVLLGKLSNREDVTVGYSVAGRHQHIDLEGIVGMFVNTLPLRTYPKGTLSFRQLLAAVKSKVLLCLDNQDYPYEELIDALGVERNTNHNPLFDILFAYHNANDAELKVPGLTIEPVNNQFLESKFDIIFSVFESDSELLFKIDYATSLFRPETIRKFIFYFMNGVAAVIDDPDRKIFDIDILGEQETRQLLYGINQTEVVSDEGLTILSLFAKQVIKTPESEAFRCLDKVMTYGELDALSDSIAGYLQEVMELDSEDLVGVLLPRSEYLIPSIMGVLKSGAAYVPIDVNYPEERINFIIENSGIKVLITDNADRLPAIRPTVKVVEINGNVQQIRNEKWKPLGVKISPNHLAYVIYTSGSTGRPKGVMIEHGALANYVRWAASYYLKEGRATFALFTSISFDLTVTSIFTPLITGGKIIVYSDHDQRSLVEQIFNDCECDIVKLTPSHLKILNGSLLSVAKPCSIGKLIVGGEELEVSLARDIYNKLGGHVEIYNEYGPTEATVGCMVYLYDPGMEFQSVPIGAPIDNTHIYILDNYLKPVPDGTQGEVYISGAGVARGYLFEESLTSERFFDSPFLKGNRIYRTGDIARRLSSGVMLFNGRVDDQVKIRGFRIEPGEIACRLTEFEGVEDAVVLAMNKVDDVKEKYLVGYYVSGEEIERLELEKFLLARLPQYMVPSFYVRLESLPMTNNGKLDVKAFPHPERCTDKAFIAPETDEEKIVAGVWSSVLGVERISVTDNFFSIGGDSIKSILINSRIKSAGYEMAVKDLFTGQTIREVAKNIKPVVSLSDQAMVTGTAPLSPIQRWFFDGPVVRKSYFNQSVLLDFPAGISESTVRAIFEKLQEHHDALRMVFRKEGKDWISKNRGTDLNLFLEVHDLKSIHHAGDVLLATCNQIQSGIDLEKGPLMRIGLFHMNSGSRVLIVIHHLVVDGISWRILFEDIETLYQQITGEKEISLPGKTDAFLTWPASLSKYVRSSGFIKATEYWNRMAGRKGALIPKDYPEGSNTGNDEGYEGIKLSKDDTSRLLTSVHFPFSTQVNDILMTALLISVGKEYNNDSVMINLEGHGREEIPNTSVSRTIGWFTTIYPVLLEKKGDSLSGIIKHVKETLRDIPNNGLDFLLLKYFDASHATGNWEDSQILFNYLGQFDSDLKGKSYTIARESSGEVGSAQEVRQYDWRIVGLVTGGELEMGISYSKTQYIKRNVVSFLDTYRDTLLEIIEYCCALRKRQLTPSDLTLNVLSMEELDALQQRYLVEDVFPLSPMQEGILYHALLDSNADHYFSQIVYEIRGNLDIAAVQRSVMQVIERYEGLRTVFLFKGLERPLQLVLKEQKFDFVYNDVRQECGESSIDQVIAKYQRQDRAEKFVLSKGPLMRLTVLKTAPDKFAFLWSYHHILMDGWCMGIIVNSFRSTYEKIRNGLSIPLSKERPYSVYIKWLEKRDKKKAIGYWENYLAGYRQLATIPGDQPSPKSLPYKLATEQCILNKDQARLLHSAAAKHGVTLNTLFQTAWGILLAKWNSVNDVVFGSVVSGRPGDIEGVDRIVGLFINTIPVRIQYKTTDSIGDLIKEVQRRALDGEQYHYTALSEIQSLTELGNGLLDHIMIFENYPVANEIEGSVDYTVTNVRDFEQTNYDLNILVIPTDTILMKVVFNSRQYTSVTIARILEYWSRMVLQIADNSQLKVSDISIITQHEQHQILNVFNDTHVGYPREETIISLFKKQVLATPQNNAVMYRDDVLRYIELDVQSDRIASYLQEVCNVNVGDLVGVMLEREIGMISSIFGILKAGAAYVPIDPHFPDARINSIIADSGLKVLITRYQYQGESVGAHVSVISLEQLMEAVENGHETPREVKVTGRDLAYVIYTSGSSGKPKGVMIEHHSVVNRIMWMQRTYPLTQEDVILQKTPIVFDVSVWELFWWSFTGAAVCLLQPGGEKDHVKIIETIQRNGVTTMHFVPSMLSIFLMNLDDEFNYSRLGSLRLVFSSGEALTSAQVKAFGKSINRFCGTRLVNLYGPTEATVDVSYYECNFREESIIPIGVPIDNTSLYVINQDYHLSPISVSGELCIAGAGLSRGYLNNDVLTNEKFVHNPFMPGEKMYKTGDLARWTHDGNLLYEGRIDDQVKIRGFRIELGEVESHLLAYPGLREAVICCKDRDDDKYLVAYYVSTKKTDPLELKNFLRQRLPDYMIPSFYVPLEQIPVTSNGKRNLKALPDITMKAAEKYVAPATPTENKLAEIWSDVLKLDITLISNNRSFFQLGGHSLKAAVMVNKVFKELNVEISLKDVFSLDTIAKMSEFIENERWIKKGTSVHATSSDELILD